MIHSVRRLPIVALVLILLVLLSPVTAGIVKAQMKPYDQKLQDAWKLAERSGQYRFTSQVTQKTIPAARLANVGQTVKTDHLAVQGEIDRRADLLQLSLWDNQATAFDPASALEIRIGAGNAQGRVPGGEWQALDDFDNVAAGDTFAPGGDVAAYLQAARHVTALGVERRNLGPLGKTLISHRYHFVVDGDVLAGLIRTQLEEQMRRKGELPPGVYLSFGDHFRQMVGVGEAWVGEDGLPQRMKVEIEFPQQQNGERLLISVQTDFSDFDNSLALTGSALQARLAILQYDLARLIDLQQIGAALGFIALLGGIILLLAHLPGRRRQMVVSLAMLFVMMGVEISKAAPPPSAFAAANNASTQSAPAQRPLPTPAPEFNTRQSPLQDQPPLPASEPGIFSRAVLDADMDALINGPDADGDGLSDALEAIWGTNPNNRDTDGDGLTDGQEVALCKDLLGGTQNGQLIGENSYDVHCSNPLAADTDGDGLSDGQEVRYLGTSPNYDDTDGDGLSDLVEVQGFMVNGVRRYTDPLNPDTDGDGILDGQECPGGVCINSRGAGDPDVFVIDNDNDGFIGGFDLSPNVVLGKNNPFTAANPFQLSIANLNPGKSIFVDFQIRPTNPNQIGYAQSVLDWPSGDTGGQIQRRLDTTFADVNPLPPGIAAPNPNPASHGDMRLVPMLEIEMPGTGAPLPRTTAAQSVSFVNVPLLAVVELIAQVEEFTLLGFTVEPEDLRIRVNHLSPDYTSYTLEIYKGTCGSALTTPVFPAASLSVNGEVTYPSGELAVIADGGHVAVLKVPNIEGYCVPISKVNEGGTQIPLNFVGPLSNFGTLQMIQSGAQQISLTLSGPDLSGTHQITLFSGSCQNPGTAVGAPITLTPGTPQTLSGHNLVALANGNHMARLQKGSRILSCAPLGNVVNGASDQTQMIDQAALAKMGITVSEKDATGALIAHIPLSMAQDPSTGVISGFAATMLYDTNGLAGSVSWQHQARMSWWVQMLTDNCSTPPDDFLKNQAEQVRLAAWCGSNANRLQLVHVYDGEWMLAGLAVREEHSYDMNILFEDPSPNSDPYGSRYLWHLVRGLDEQFATGVDCVRINAGDPCSQDGQRDYTLQTLYNIFEKSVNGATSETERWGIPADKLRVVKLHDQLDTYLDMGLVMSTYVPNLLETHFLAFAATHTPLLTFASENSFRSVALGTQGYATTTANGATINFAPGGLPAQAVVTIASLSWAPYRLNANTGNWESYPFMQYWDLLELRLKESNAFGDGANEDDRIVGEGLRLIAKSYFTYLYQGRANLVESNGTPLGLLDSSAALYISRQERVDSVVEVADTLGAINGSANLMLITMGPFVRHLILEFNRGQWQRWVVANGGGAMLKNILATGLINNDLTYRNVLRNAFLKTRTQLSGDYVVGLKGSKVRAGVGGFFAVAAIGTGIYAAVTYGDRGEGGKAAQQVFTAIGTSLAGLSLIALSTAAYTAAKNKIGLAAKFAEINQKLATTSKSAKIAGVVALIIVQAINLGGLIAAIAINGYTLFGLQANQLAAQSIASAITAGIMFALASTGVGAIVVAIIGLIDGAIALICGLLSKEENESIPGRLFCRGISGWLTDLISFGIYAQNEITRINDPYRLNFLSFRPGLSNPAGGFRPEAGVHMDLTVRNTLALARLPINLGISWGWQFGESYLRTSRFAYHIVAAQPDKDADKPHNNLARKEGPDPWTLLPQNSESREVVVYNDWRVTADNLLRLPAAPGLNRPVPGYLAEAYQVPVQECIANPGILPLPPFIVCWVRSRGDTNYNDLNLAFDVFPPTLDAFYALAPVSNQPGRYRLGWANNSKLDFPPLFDADGDGLSWDADRDDTRWDTDGDGLSDAVEKARNTDPGNPDSDGDGLSDAEEALWGTDPNNADTDGDGLTDGEEVAGWSIGYGVDANGNVLMSWTRSNPLRGDVDGDGILDSQEKIYGFNPHVPNDSTALLYQTALIEKQAPLLLTRFEERAGAASFADSSGSTAGNVAGCDAATCPIAGVQGRFGNAAHFNGTDQYLTIPPNEAIGKPQTNFTVSAWVKPAKLSGTQAVVQIGPGGPNGVGGFTFGLSDANLFVRFEGGGPSFVQPAPSPIRLNEWNHITVESFFGSLYFSVNGLDVLGGSHTKVASSNPKIVIGAAQQPSSNVPPDQQSGATIPLIQIEHFAGAIDEVLIQDWVPADTSSIQALFAGRYNLADLILRPSQEVAVNSSLENALLARRISGQRQINYPSQLTGTPSVLSPFVLEPTQSATYDDSFVVAGGAPSGIYTLTQSVDAMVSIPAEDVWVNPASNQTFSWDGPQSFAGVSYSDSGNKQINLNSKSFTMAGWVRPTNTDTTRRGILGRNSGQNDAFPYLLSEGRQLKFGFGRGSNLTEVTATNGANTNVLNLNQWNFIAVRYNLTGGSVTFFVNGQKLNTVTTNATPNTPARTFFIGRASNLGQVNLTRFDLICEGDGAGDGEYDIIGVGASGAAQNLTRLVGTEPRTWNFNITRTFNESYTVMVCEDDNGVNTDCAPNDEFMGERKFSTNNPSSGPHVAKLAYPAGATGCSYNWGMAGWPDVADLTYSFTNDSLPFVGDLRRFEIHEAALSDEVILNIAKQSDTLGYFQFNQPTGASSFPDETGFHRLVCDPNQNTCPSAGVPGTFLTGIRFDGVDDSLIDDPNATAADKLLANLAGNNNGYTIRFYIKPSPSADPSKPRPIYTIYDSNNNIRMQLALVHAGNGYRLRVIDNYQLLYASELCTTQPYDQWTPIRVEAQKVSPQHLWIYAGDLRCHDQFTYTPTLPAPTDRLVIGTALSNVYAPYQGSLDALQILRRPIKDADSSYWDLNAPTVESFENPAQWNRPLAKGVVGQAIQFSPGNLAPEPFNHQSIYTTEKWLFTYSFTLAFWLKAEQSNGSWHTILSSQEPGSNRLKQLISLSAGHPQFLQFQEGGGMLLAETTKPLQTGVWQHVVFRVRNKSTGCAGCLNSEMSIFINGFPATLKHTNNATVIQWNTQPVPDFIPNVKLGIYREPPLLMPFVGLIDEFTLFRNTLTDQEVREFYNQQNAWVGETKTDPVNVDADPPTSILELGADYLPNHDRRLYVAAQDPTSRVFHVELGVDRGNGIRWSGAERDDGDRTGNTWLPLFTPNGEGAYTLYTRATDSVGNQETPSTGKTVYVDGQPPTLTFNPGSSLLNRPLLSSSEEAVWHLRVEGAYGDPLIQGTGQPGSGVASIEVTLFDKNGETATLFDTQSAAIDPNSDSWSLDYRLNLANPTGVYSVTAVATDGVGNQTRATPIVIAIDTTAPAPRLTYLNSPGPQARADSSAFPAILNGDSVIGGVASEKPSDVPAQQQVAGVDFVEVAFEPLFTHGSPFRNQKLPTGTRLYLPLDESGRTDSPDISFADVSPAGQLPVICAGAGCPQAGAAGKMGQALAFDGINNSLILTHTASINGLANDFTVGAWVKPGELPWAHRIVSTARTQSNNGFGVGTFGRKLLMTTYGVKDYISSADWLIPGVWQHVAMYMTADNAVEFYVNGQLVETIPGAAPAVADNDDRLLIGATTEAGQSATSQHFPGLIDEVVVMAGRPSAADWQILLGADPTLHLTFDGRFIHPNTRMSNDAGLGVGDLAYLSSLPADMNLRHTGIVGTGSIYVNGSGSIIGATAPGVLPHQNQPFTLSFWASLDNANALMGLAVGDAGNLIRLIMRATSVSAEFTGKPNLAVTTANLVGAWQHVALTYDGSTRILYLNGVEIGRGAIAPNTLNTASVGMVLAEGTGFLDDLRVYRYTLTAREMKALAEMGWLMTDTQMSRNINAEATWSASVPPGLEGFYELKSRGTDLLGNVGEAPKEIVTWRGMVDSLAPRLLAFSATPTANGVNFSLTVEDFALAVESVTMPAACTSSNTTTSTEQYQSPWYLSFAGQASSAESAAMLSRVFRLTIQCQAGFAQTNDTFRVCDQAGNCTEAKYTGANVGTPPTATPTPTAIVTTQPGATSTPTATATTQPGATSTPTPTATPTPGGTSGATLYLPSIQADRDNAIREVPVVVEDEAVHMLYLPSVQQ
jgi:hypothetical protein